MAVTLTNKMIINMLAVIALLNTTAFCLDTAMAAEPTFDEIGLTVKERDMIIQTAKKKAGDLGYPPEESNFTLTKEKNMYRADFSPKQKKGVVIYGGNLTIYLDRKGHVLRYQESP
jgi:hypothetical protein